MSDKQRGRSRNRTIGIATAASGSSYGLALLGLVVSFFAIGARWLWLYRRGQPFDIDEAGYLMIALGNYHALIDDGVGGWLSSVLGPSLQGPLTTALASLIFYGTGPQIIAGFAVPLLAGTGCVIATYFLGKAIGSRQIGLGASILVASCPVILSYSRSFHFSLPAALLCTVMLTALVKSQRFERIGWSALFGLTLGLMPLARTMTIGFVPGAVAAAAVYALAEPASRVRRMLVLSASLGLAALTAATWLVPNGGRVYEYLFSFGYGARAVEYEAAGSVSAWDAWLTTVRALCNHDVYLPHLLVMAGGGVATMVVAWTRLRGARRLPFLQIVRAPVVPVVIVVAEALLALASSRNQSGSAFFAPIVPAAMVVTVWACLGLSPHRYYQLTLRVVAAVVAIMASAPLVDLRSGIAFPWLTEVPLLGRVTVTDGRGTFQDYAAAGDIGSLDVADSIDRTAGAQWLSLDRDTAAAITRAHGASASIAFGFRHRLFNVNTVNLQQVLGTGMRFDARQVEPTVTGVSVQDYVAWLAGEAATACVLVTSDSDRGQFAPVVNPARMREAAERADFTPTERRLTPDGQTITIWRHRVVPPSCGGGTGATRSAPR